MISVLREVFELIRITKLHSKKWYIYKYLTNDENDIEEEI